jgi:cell division inhibitor SepF
LTKKNKFIDKVLDAFGFETQEEGQFADLSEEAGEKKKANLVGLPAAVQLKVQVLEPVGFEDAAKAADHLKGRKQVVINLEHLNRETAQRVVDFLSGVTYALNGTIQKVGNNIFLFAPSNVIITAELKPAADKGININWDKWDKNSKGD